jgi:Tfp pilus assembly protein PilE
MGQQQLLLVILVTIIVGIATVVALNIFGSAAEQANQDAVRQDLLAAAAQAQGIYSRPEMMGGAGGDFSQLPGTAENTLAERLNIPGTIAGNVVTNENAEYTVTIIAAGDGVSIDAVPTGSPEAIDVEVERQASGNWITRLTVEGQPTVTIGEEDAPAGT